MADPTPAWPEFPVELITDRTSPESQALWEGWLRAARQAGAHGPMPALPGVEIVVRHECAREILSDEARYPQNFTSSFRSMAVLNPQLGADFHALLDEMDASSLINQGGDRHRALRALLGRAFTARTINQVRPFIRDLARHLVAAMQPGDDYVSAFALRVPSTTLCELVGIPEADRDRCTEWVAELAVLLSPIRLLTLDAAQAGEVVAAREALVAYGTDLIARRRVEPLDDLVSHLAQAADDRFDDRALALNIADLLFGGNDNTQRALGQMVLVLVERPDVWDAVGADPAVAEPVVEELLRYRPPSPGAFRRTAAPVDLGGGPLDEDQALWASSYSVNRDEALFDDGAAFAPLRANARDHLSFGHGAHHCIGASLARAELQECLRVLTATITCPRISGEVVIVNDGAAGPVHLPITFTRRP